MQHGPVRRKADHRCIRIRGKDRIPRAEALQRFGQLRCAKDQRLGRRTGQWRALRGDAAEGFEQHRCREITAERAGYRRAIGAAQPDANDMLPVKAHRPGIAVPVGRAGLVGHRPSARRAPFGRGDACQYIADLPCCRR